MFSYAESAKAALLFCAPNVPLLFWAIPAHLCVAKKGENCYTLIY